MQITTKGLTKQEGPTLRESAFTAHRTPFAAKNAPYIDLQGLERELPAVVKFASALGEGRTIALVDGGKAGKTELMSTVMRLSGKDYLKFDLRDWVIEKLSHPEVPANLRQTAAQPDHSQDLDQLLEQAGLSSTIPLSASRVRQAYRNDSSGSMEKLECRLLERYQNDLAELFKRSTAEVLVLDEFDLVNRPDISETKLKSVQLLFDAAKQASTKQLVLIAHPRACSDDYFFKLLVANFPGCRECTLEHIPSRFALKALELAGIRGGEAQQVIAECKGLPLAYRDLFINREGLREQLGKTQITAADYLNGVEREIRGLGDKLLLGLPRQIRDLVYDSAAGRPLPRDLPFQTELLLEASTLFYRDGRGHLTMAPIVRRALSPVKT